MAANDRRAATAKADLISVRKKWSDMSGPKPVYVNHETYRNRNTGNGPSEDSPMKIVGPKACGPIVSNENLMKPSEPVKG